VFCSTDQDIDQQNNILASLRGALSTSWTRLFPTRKTTRIVVDPPRYTHDILGTRRDSHKRKGNCENSDSDNDKDDCHSLHKKKTRRQASTTTFTTMTANSKTPSPTTMDSPSTADDVTTPQLPPPPREVASGMINLGNTCYMNAVLQALAHAPELCHAMDCEPHSQNCPIAKSNAIKRRNSPKASPENSRHGSGSAGGGGINGGNGPSTGSRKSRRSGRRSPSQDSISNGGEKPSDPNELEFCALCEIEHHLTQAHYATSSTNTTNSKPEMDAVSPASFVHGFMNKYPQFKMGVQEDSHEFLRLLIDAMQESCSKARIRQQEEIMNDPQKEITSNNKEQQEQEDPQKPSTTSPPPQETSPQQEQSQQQSQDTEYPFKLFRGTVESNVTCESCGACSSKIDPIEDIGLEVTPLGSSSSSSSNSATTTTAGGGPSSSRNSPPPPPALVDVPGAFQRFIQEEPLGGYKCDKCSKIGKASKQSRLASIPPILTLHLKRFRYGNTGTTTTTSTRLHDKNNNTSSGSGSGSGSNSHHGGNGAAPPMVVPLRRTGRSELNQLLAGTNSSDLLYYGGTSGSAKIEGHVKYQEVFDILPFCQPALQEKHKRMYCRLFAVIVHAGKNSHSGHYISYVRNVNKNEWWKMDDARVTRASSNEVMSAEAYMLFYRVVDHPVAVQLRKEAKLIQDSKMKAAMEARQRAQEKAAVAAATAIQQQQQQNNNSNNKKKRSKQDSSLSSSKNTTTTNNKRNNSSTSTEQQGNHDNDDVVLQQQSKKRKKRPIQLTGEEWAKAKTRLPPKFYSILRRAEEFVSDHVEFKPEYFSLIYDEASTVGQVGNGPSIGVSPDEDASNPESFRRALFRFLCNLATGPIKDTNKDFFSTTTPTTLNDKDDQSVNSVTDDEKVMEEDTNIPVVDETFL